MLEITRIASGDRGVPGASNGSDHGVKRSNGTPDLLTTYNNLRKDARGLLIEGQNPALKFLSEKFLDCLQEACPALT